MRAVSPTDPSLIGQWDAQIKWPAVAVHLVLLHTGKVLFWRGDGSTPKTFAWDPATEQIQTFLQGADLFCAGHSFLSDGRVLVTGGAQPHSNHVLIFDPVTSQWSNAPSMRRARFYPTNVALGDGRTLIFSGRDASGKLNDQVEAFVPGTGGAPDRIDLLSSGKTFEFYPRMQLLPNGKVIHVGEEQETETYDPATGSWTLVATSQFGRRYEGTDVVLPPGRNRIMIMGGGGKSGAVTNTAEIIDLSAPTPAWRYTNPMGSARQHLQNVTLPDGTILVAGGVGSKNVLPCEIFDPVTEIWTPVAPLASSRGYHSTAILLPDGRVLEAGANGNPSRQIYSPPYLFRGPRPVIDSAPASVGYGETFSVATADAGRIAKAVFMRPGASTHSANMEQRYVPVSFTVSGAGSLDIVAPSEPNVAPPGYYLLFLVDGDGVPSKAPFVLLRAGSGPTTTSTTLAPGATTTTTPAPTSTTVTTLPPVPTTTTTTLPAIGSGTIDVRISAKSDDAEEHPNQKVDIKSSTLELIHEKDDQIVGLRFAKVAVPPGARITAAWLQLKSDKAGNVPTSLVIAGQAANKPPTFTTAKGNISSRLRTGATVSWPSIPAWAKAEANANERTPDLSLIVQEMVGRSGWASNDPLVFIITGSGTRIARSMDGDKAGAALLHIEYGPPLVTTLVTTTTTSTTIADPTTTTSTEPDPTTTTTEPEITTTTTEPDTTTTTEPV